MAEATIRVKAIGVYEDILTDLNKAERAISRSRLGINRRSVVEPLGRMAQSASEFEKSLAASNARVIAFGASVGIISGMQKAFSELVKQTIAVEKALTDIQVVLNTTPKNLEKFSKDLFSIAKNTGNSFFDVAQAALEFSRQGLGAQETLKRVNDAMILVRLSGVDATKAIEGLTSILNSFQDVALDTTKIINKLATVDAAFAISSGDLVEAFSRVGSAAQDAGLNLDELIGIVTAARQITGRSGSVIGNSLKTIFTRLQRSDTLDALEGLGVATRDANGGFRDAISLLTDLSNKYTDLNDAQKAYVSELVGGVFQINVLKATLGDLSREFSVYGNAVSISTNATDEAIKRNEVLNRTLSAQANSLKNTVVQLFSSLGQAGLDKPVKVFIDLAQKLTSTLNEAVGEETGGSFAKGLIKGLGNFISGPGLAIVGGVLVKLFLTTSKFAVTSLKSLLSIGDETSKIKNLQSQINALLAEQNTSYSQILARTGDRVAAEKEILRIIQQQQIARHTSMSGVGASLYRQGLRYTDDKGFTTTFKGNLPASKLRAVRGAEGILPAIVKEKMATNKGVGGASSAAKPVVIKDFNFGQGKKGTVVANTDEYIVPNFAGGDGHAIFNKHMVRKYGLPAGAKRITTAAQGLVNDVQEIETDKGRIILGFQGKTGIIQNIGTSYPGQGATRDLYQKAFDIARARGVQSIQGNLWKQNHKVPRGKSPLDWVKGTIPQIIRGRYGKSSTLTIDGRKINLAGGELFDEDLKKKSGHIASLLDRAEGIDYITNLASGRLPKELSGQAISRLKYFLSDGNVKVTNDSDTRDRFIRHNGTDSINISGNPIGKYGSSFVLAHEAGHYAHAISDRLDFSRAALSKDYFKKLSSERLANQNALTLISAFGDKKDAKAYKNFSRLQMLRGYKLPYISKIFGEKGIKGLGDILKVGLYPSYASGYISNHALGSPYPTRGLPHAYVVGTNKGFFSFKKKKEATTFAKKVSSKIIYPINNKFDHLGNENKVTSVEEALSRYGNFASGFVPGNKYRFKRQSAGDLLFNQFGSEEQALEYFLGIAGGDPRVLLQARASLGVRGSSVFSFLENLSSLKGISNRKGQRIYEKKIEEMALRNQLAGLPRKLQASGSRALNLPDFDRGELVNMRFFLQGKGKNYQNFAQIKKFLGRPTPVVSDRDIRQQRNRFDLQEQLSRVLGAPFLSNEYSQFEKELQAEIAKVNSRGDADSELRKATLAARFPKLLNRGPSGPLANIPPRTKSGGGGFGGGGGGNVPPSAGGFEFDDEEARYFREILQGRRARFANNRNRNAGNQASLGANFNFRGKDFANYFAGNFGAGLNSFQPLAASIAYPGYFQDMLRADKRNRPARARITQTTYGKTRGAYDFSTQTTDVERGFGGNVNELTNVQLSGLLGRAVGSKDRATAVRDLRERLFRQVSIKEGKVSAQPVRDIAKFNKEIFGGQNLQQTFLEEVRKNIQEKGTGLAMALQRATKEVYELGATQDQINKYISKNGKTFDRIQREHQKKLEEETQLRRANNSVIQKYFRSQEQELKFNEVSGKVTRGGASKQEREFYERSLRSQFLQKQISSFEESTGTSFNSLGARQRIDLVKKFRGQQTGLQDFLFQQRVSELETQNLKPSGAFGGIFQRALNRASDPLTSRRILAQEKALGEFGGKLSPQELQLRKQELDDLKKQRSNALKGRLQNAGLGVSLGLSVGAGFAKEGSVLGGALQGASLGATGFLVSGPFGIISTVAGGIVGAAKALKDKLKPSVEQLAAAAQANAEQFARTSEAFTGYLQTLSRMDEGFRKGNLKPIEEEILNRELGKNLSIISGQNPGIAKQIEEAGRTRNFEALGGIQAQVLREGQRTKDQLELRALFANEVNQLTDKDFRKNFDYSNRYTTGVLAGPTVTRSLNLSDKRLEGYGSVAKSAVTANALYTDENLTKFKGLNQDDALKQVFGENYKTDENVQKFVKDAESIKVLMGLITKEAEEQNVLWKISQKTINENKKTWERVSVIVSRINQIGFDTQLSTLQKFNNQSNNINLRRGLIDSQVGLDPSLRSRLQTGLDIKQIGLEKETSLQELNASGYKELVALFEESRNDAGLKLVEEQRKQGKDVVDTLKRLIDSSIGSVDELKKIQQEVVNQKALLEENVRAQIEIKRTGLKLDLANIKADRLRGLIGGQSPLDFFKSYKENPQALQEILGNAVKLPSLSLKNSKNEKLGRFNLPSLIEEASALQDQQNLFGKLGIAPTSGQTKRFEQTQSQLGASFYTRFFTDQLKSLGSQNSDIFENLGIKDKNVNQNRGQISRIDEAIKILENRLKVNPKDQTTSSQIDILKNFKKIAEQGPAAARVLAQDLNINKLAKDIGSTLGGGSTLTNVRESVDGVKSSVDELIGTIKADLGGTKESIQSDYNSSNNVPETELIGIDPLIESLKNVTVFFDNLGNKFEGKIENVDTQSNVFTIRDKEGNLKDYDFNKFNVRTQQDIYNAADPTRKGRKAFGTNLFNRYDQIKQAESAPDGKGSISYVNKDGIKVNLDPKEEDNSISYFVGRKRNADGSYEPGTIKKHKLSDQKSSEPYIEYFTGGSRNGEYSPGQVQRKYIERENPNQKRSYIEYFKGGSNDGNQYTPGKITRQYLDQNPLGVVQALFKEIEAGLSGLKDIDLTNVDKLVNSIANLNAGIGAVTSSFNFIIDIKNSLTPELINKITEAFNQKLSEVSAQVDTLQRKIDNKPQLPPKAPKVMSVDRGNN